DGRPRCPPWRHPGERKDSPFVRTGMQRGQSDWVRRNVGLITSVAFTPDGRRVVTCSDEGTARVWDAGTGAQLGEPLAHAAGIKSGLLSSDGTTLVTADGRGEVRVWDLATRKLRFEPPKQPADPTKQSIRGWTVALHPKGSRLATAEYGQGV